MFNSFKQFLCFTLLALSACTEASIFPEIPLGLSPPTLANPIDLVVSTPRQRLYVLNSDNRVRWQSGSLLVFDLSDPVNPQAIDALALPSFSGEMLLDEAAGFLYVTNRQSDSEQDEVDAIFRINIEEGSANYLHLETFASADNPFGLALLGTDSLLIASEAELLRHNLANLNNFSAVDLSGHLDEEADEINVIGTKHLSLSPNGDYLWVSNRGGQALLLNVAAAVAPSGTGRQDLGTAAVDYLVSDTASTRDVTRDGDFLYVLEGTPPTLRILETAALSAVEGSPINISLASLQVGSIALGGDPSKLLLNGSQAYVTNRSTDDVSFIDLNLLTEVARVSVSTTEDTLEETGNIEDGDQPFALAVFNDFLYVGHFESNLISIINVNSRQVVAVFP